VINETIHSLRTSTSNSTSSGGLKVGDGLEISPLTLAVCEDIGRALSRSSAGGAALLVDYGEDFTQEDSLRAFKNHQQVHILSQVCALRYYISIGLLIN